MVLSPKSTISGLKVFRLFLYLKMCLNGIDVNFSTFYPVCDVILVMGNWVSVVRV